MENINGAGANMFRQDQLKREAPDPTSGPPNPEEDARHRQEAENAARNQREEIFENVIRNSDKPGDILLGVRKIMEMAKDSNTTEAQDDSWGVRTLSKYLYQKRLAMQMSGKELEARGWIKDYDEKTGTARTVDRRAAGFAIKMEEKMGDMVVAEIIRNKKTGEESEVLRPTTVYEFKYGTPEERKNMELGLTEIYLEIGVDTTIGSYLGAQRAYRDDLANLTAVEYSRLHHFTHDQLVYMVNRTDEAALNEISGSVESRKSGEDEVAIWWYLGMMACETRAGLEDFLDKPATDALVMPKASKEDRIRFLKVMFGDWTTWTDKGRTPKTLAEEVKEGKRGPVSKYGNIPARGRGEKLDFDYTKEMEYVQDIIGKMPGTSVESSWYASSVLRVWDELSINGVVRFPDATNIKDRVRLALGTDIYLQGNDLGKANPEYEVKEFGTGRVFGPEGMVGKVPQWALSYLDHAQIRVGYSSEGDPVTLPLRLAWLGDKARKIEDQSTSTIVDVPAIPYTPLGKVDFGTLPRGDFEAFTQLHALAAREGWVFDMVTDNEPEPKSFLEKGLRTIRKRTSIIWNPLIALLGDFRGQTNPGKVATDVAQGVMDDLLEARKNTQSYILNVEGKDFEIFDASQPSQKNLVSAEGVFEENAKKLGMRRGTTFNPDKQFLNNRNEIKSIPKKGGLAGAAGKALNILGNIGNGGRR